MILSRAEEIIKAKIENRGIPLKNWDVNIYRGILTGYNEAFIIDSQTKNGLINASPKSAEIIRPILKGRDIKKYAVKFADRWIIFARRGININDYPAVKDHLHKFYEFLKPKQSNDVQGRKAGTYKWYEIQDNIAYYEDFDKEKIIWMELSDIPKFSYDNEKYLVETTGFILTGKKLKFLTAFLNSSLCDWYFDKITTTSGVGTNRWKKIYIEKLPIPVVDQCVENSFNLKIDELLLEMKSGQNTDHIDFCVNKMVLDLYNLDAEEKKIILEFKHS